LGSVDIRQLRRGEREKKPAVKKNLNARKIKSWLDEGEQEARGIPEKAPVWEGIKNNTERAALACMGERSQRNAQAEKARAGEKGGFLKGQRRAEVKDFNLGNRDSRVRIREKFCSPGKLCLPKPETEFKGRNGITLGQGGASTREGGKSRRRKCSSLYSRSVASYHGKMGRWVIHWKRRSRIEKKSHF